MSRSQRAAAAAARPADSTALTRSAPSATRAGSGCPHSFLAPSASAKRMVIGWTTQSMDQELPGIASGLRRARRDRPTSRPRFPSRHRQAQLQLLQGAGVPAGAGGAAAPSAPMKSWGTAATSAACPWSPCPAAQSSHCSRQPAARASVLDSCPVHACLDRRRRSARPPRSLASTKRTSCAAFAAGAQEHRRN